MVWESFTDDTGGWVNSTGDKDGQITFILGISGSKAFSKSSIFKFINKFSNIQGPKGSKAFIKSNIFCHNLFNVIASFESRK